MDVRTSRCRCKARARMGYMPTTTAHGGVMHAKARRNTDTEQGSCHVALLPRKAKKRTAVL